jgi:uncharacterized membrane protein YgcG
MHALDVIFWIFFASVVAFIGWSFLRMFVEVLSDRRPRREGRRRARSSDAVTLGGVTADAATGMIGSDHGSSNADSHDVGGESNNGDFSGGGGEYGGGGSSGGW